MDGDIRNVFVSKINRSFSTLQNNLYEILNKDVIEPLKLTSKNEVQDECEFKPRVNKYYVSKKKSKLKVFTVRDIRNLYERNNFKSLPLELERQEKYLLRKIRGGYFRNEDTRNIALNLLTSDKPLSRTAWQMLMNLNLNGHTHSSQYVLWNGQRIQINGSKGGKNKFLCNYDVSNDQGSQKKAPITKRKDQTRRALLRDSLNIRFKPGPLQKKKDLDDSYQKYNVGETKVVNLPEIGLHIQPSYGKALEPTITTFLQNMRALDGMISEKWAEFAGSAVGKATDEGVKIVTEKPVIFNLNYKCDQKRILMRNDTGTAQNPHNNTACCPLDVPFTSNLCNDDVLTQDINDIMVRMLDSVEISLNQHSMYSGEDEPREISAHNATYNTSGIQSKEKEKRRRYCELDRLDVTVIRIPKKRKSNNSEPCQQPFCSLGCVCDSLQCSYQIKDHCGKIECMFGCNCDFSKSNISDSLEGNCSEFIPGLVYLDKKINDKLAKEEQKFHQTVIVTDDKSILLKSRRRNWKTSKKYADFYSSMRLRTEIKNQKFPMVVMSKMKCENIEPWCMVHNLYRCFCKGKFLQSNICDSVDVDAIPSVAYKDRGDVLILEKTQKSPENHESDTKTIVNESDAELSDSLCARVMPFHSRKFSVEYYRSTNEKIYEMEKNDKKLHTKMMSLINVVEGSEVDENQPRDKFLDVNNTVIEGYDNIGSRNQTVNFNNYISSDFLCARILPFESRKYSDGYYRRKNELIYKRERKDKNLQNKLMSLINSDIESFQGEVTDASDKILDVVDEISSNMNEVLVNSSPSNECGLENARVLLSKPENSKPTTKLMKWLQNNLTKHFLESIERGHWTTSLSRPNLGKVALYPWKFILSRYQEQKNLFLLSTRKPFRIFMAVNRNHALFDACINISDIPICSIGDYPDMVRSLVTNADHDNFCILSGLPHCWELVGTVNKPKMQNENKTTPVNKVEKTLDGETSDDSKNVQNDIISNNINWLKHDEKNNAGISKWFIMTIEDDVNELQLVRKGFFVKYDSIIRSINIARKVGKTLRLSSQKCIQDNIGPSFGIYVTADTNANTLFIGPYEENEPLGIQTSRNSNEVVVSKKTGGLWITVNKTDNLKLIDNPLLYLPSLKNDCNSIVTLDSDTDTDSDSTKEKKNSLSSENAELSDEKGSSRSNTDAKTIKSIKPIRIRKTDSFYHLGSQRFLKQLAFTKCVPQNNRITDPNIAPLSTFSLNKVPVKSVEIPQFGTSPTKSISSFNKPAAEIGPQIKINNISALCNNSSTTEPVPNKRKSEGMFVLKPEEINKRLANNYFRFMEPIESACNNFDKDLPSSEKKIDVELLLNTSIICAAPPDVYVISDDEEDNNKRSSESVFQDVWITCGNISNVGWISGRRNSENKLSFEFPGCVSTDYYNVEEALDKLHQMFSKNITIPTNIQAKWKVIDNEKDLNGRQKLRKEDLNSDFVLTERGLIHKDNLVVIENESTEDSSDEGPGNTPEEGMVVEKISGNEKIINADNLSNENYVQGNVTAVASTSIDADGNDQGIKIYMIEHTDVQEGIVNEKPYELVEFIEPQVEKVLTATEMEVVESID